MDAINGIRNQVAQPTSRASGRLERSDALNILDEFWMSPGSTDPFLIPAPHGVKVHGAALGAGFQGRVNCIQVRGNPLLNFQMESEMDLQLLDLEPERARQLMERYVQSQSMAVMLLAGAELESQSQTGTHGSVTNISIGGGPATATDLLYEQARLGWQPGADDPKVAAWVPQLMRNLARALEVAPEALVSPDPEVCGPARARFQQQLVEFATRAYQTSVVQDFRAAYAQKVIQYEALGNSVVVSAGNEGELPARMKGDNGGRDILIPDGFFDKALGTVETTCVGSLGFAADNSPKVADYSSGGDQVAVLAWGRAPDGQPGTSFAAPRVAAVMQRIHQENPGMSSAEVERRMLDLQTVPVQGTRALIL